MGRGWDADVVVVGSGFGGAVTALRLAEAGHRVVVLEKGRRLSDDDLLRARRDPRAYLWQPGAGLRGFFWQRIFKHVAIIGGTGVGGGSIVWAGVLLEPGDAFYDAPALRAVGIDKAGLAPHLATAARMLGRVTSPHRDLMDDHLQSAAESIGVGDTFGPVPTAIHFGRPGVTEPDPFFGGDGPERTGCRLCGECLLGCPYGAKNELRHNYLHLAERLGVEIRPEHEVHALRPVDSGYVVESRHPWRKGRRTTTTARRVVLAGGVLGTLELLHRCRDELGILPAVSPLLGQHVRTNSEALTAILQPPGDDLSYGPTISSHFHPDDRTHVTQNRYMGGWHMRAQLGPMVDDDQPGRRARRVLAALAARPLDQARLVGARDFLRRLTVLTTMQHHDSELALELRRSPWQPWQPWRRGLRSRITGGVRPPSNLPLANEVTRAFARASGGRALNLLGESVGGLSVTAHVLGGAVMGPDVTSGVVDAHHEVHGHPGLYVVDASVIPANLGVNPSLTITALAERFAAGFPTPPTDDQPPPGGAPMNESVLSLKRRWPELAAPRPEDLLHEFVGDLEASFVTPLTRVAPPGLGLIGLRNWYGKRFRVHSAGVEGVNLVRREGTLAEVLPMALATAPSLTDGRPALVVSYASDAPRPWRWVRDEVRALPDGRLVGMTYVDLPGLRRLGGTPFLLTPSDTSLD